MKLEEYKAGEYKQGNGYKAFYQVILIITGDGMIRN